MRSLTMLAILPLLVGCTKVDPKSTQAWDRACHANESVPQAGTAEQYNAQIVSWIGDHVHDDGVKTTFAKTSTVTAPEDKAKLVRDAAGNAGVSDCPVVDAMWPPKKK